MKVLNPGSRISRIIYCICCKQKREYPRLDFDIGPSFSRITIRIKRKYDLYLEEMETNHFLCVHCYDVRFRGNQSIHYFTDFVKQRTPLNGIHSAFISDWI